MSDYLIPVDEPLFTHLLAEQWAGRPPKPTALGTMLRYSGAYGCLRKMGYDWFEAEYTEPLTPAGGWQMQLGTLIHEAVQAAIAERFPNAMFEASTQVNEFLSGSCDAFVPDTPLGNVLYELKTMGTYAFDQQTGLKRGYGKLTFTNAQGPKQGAIVQAGMNALGMEARGLVIDTLVLGSLTLETVSEKMLRQLNLRDFARFGAEFHLPREFWYPMTMSEITRLSEAGEALDLGYLPDRWAKDDHGNDLKLNPLGDNWQCSYCPYQTLCVTDREGQVRINDSKLTKRTLHV